MNDKYLTTTPENHVKPPFHALPPAAREFLKYLAVSHGCSEKTIQEYARDLHTFFQFLLQSRREKDKNDTQQGSPHEEWIDTAFLRSVTREELNRYIAWLRTEKTVSTGRADTRSPGLSPAATRRRAACLRSFFRYLTETAGILDQNPAASLTAPKRAETLPFFFTEEECRRLLDAVDGINRERDYALVLLALVSGLRVSELASLNVYDIRSSQELFFFRVTGKGGRERQIFLSENCISALDRYLAIREAVYRPAPEDRDALFLSRKHHRISADAVQDLVKRTARRAGLPPVSPHKLRHTAASLMLGNGVDIRTISEVLGHRSISSTQIYTHLQSAQLIEACRANPASRMGYGSEEKTHRDRLENTEDNTEESTENTAKESTENTSPYRPNSPEN